MTKKRHLKQTCRADPLITELRVRRVLDSLMHIKAAALKQVFPDVVKALDAHVPLVLARMFNISLHTVQIPEDWCPAVVIQFQNPPHNRPKAIQTHQPHVCL